VRISPSDGRVEHERLVRVARDYVVSRWVWVSYADAGAAANDAGVKIHSCELGCF
jgi:hypothetical protein